MTAPTASPTAPWHATGIAWAFGLLALLGVRYRGEWATIVELHRWLRDVGVPDWLRGEDGFLLQLLLVTIGAWLSARALGGRALAALWWQRGNPGWLRVTVLAALPMLVGGMLLGWLRGGSLLDLQPLTLWRGSLRAPLIEELLCRGLMVGVVASGFGALSAVTRGAWIGSALVFGSLHIPWSWQGLAAGWPTLLVTTIGGLWFAWLMLRWRSLWPPVLLHAAMNLGWYLSQASGGAGGGALAENLLRIATITLATAATLRSTPR
jgi:membrane protease YdiL (CAAX protease family)